MHASADAIVRTRNLTRRFGPLEAVRKLDLQVAKGEIFGLVGPDGAGKTTILRLLCGLLDPSEGEAQVAGYDASRDAESVKDQIGYMAQRFSLYADLTVEENMRFYADLYGISRVDRLNLMTHLLRMTRMEPFRARRAGRLSGGMKQKLALMCALLHRPKVLFLDEPTNGVDPVSRRDFWELLHRLVQEGMTVFVATAYMDEAERCDRVGLMHQGLLVRCDSPAALKLQIEEECYEVRAPDLRAAKQFLETAPGVASVEPAGAALHLFLSARESSFESLERELEKGGHGAASFKRIVPSLEDVFIYLIRKEAATRTQ